MEITENKNRILNEVKKKIVKYIYTMASDKSDFILKSSVV